MKKTGVIVLAVVLVMAMTVAAFADPTTANMTGESGVIGEFTTPDTPTTYTDTVVIYKEITAYNPESCTVNAPTITYNYTIAAATVATGTTITDNSSHHDQINGTDVNATVAVKAGVGTPTITGTAANALAITPANQLSASEYGTSNRFALTVDFSTIDWATDGTGAGVYRYVINETTTETIKNASGIAEGAVANTLYMDVYVDGSGNIYGYTLFTDNETIDATSGDSDAATAAGKVEGFVDDPVNTVYSSTNTSAADKYYTYNFSVKKIVDKDQYAINTAHEFPFDITFTNSTVTVAVLPIIDPDTNGGVHTPTWTIDDAAVISSFHPTYTDLTISNGKVVTFRGIPCGTTVTINEKNDVVGVTYISESINADTNAAAKSINTTQVSNDAIIDCNVALTAANENHTAGKSKVVTFTNTLLQISPTGVVLRVAPYLAMLAAGIALIVVFAVRHRKHVEEE